MKPVLNLVGLLCYVSLCEGLRAGTVASSLSYIVHVDCCGLSTIVINKIIRPPVYGSNGRTYKMLVMFFLFLSTPNLRAPSANHRETSPHDRCLCLFYKLTTKIRGALNPKKLGAKNMQNFGRFHTTYDLSRISPERLKISKIWKLIHRWQYLVRYMKKVRWTLVH